MENEYRRNYVVLIIASINIGWPVLAAISGNYRSGTFPMIRDKTARVG